MVFFTVSAMVRGYHIYKEIWNAEVNEELTCEREIGNRSDTFAVAVKKGTVTVGHIPRCISSICSIFIRRGGSITCTVTGNRRYSSDLPQGGLELPCILTFSTDNVKERDKTAKLVKASLLKVPVTDSTEIQSPTVKLEIPEKEIESSCTKPHTSHIEEMPISIDSGDEPPKKKSCYTPIIDTQLIVMGDRLTDREINHSQKILKLQFPELNGLRLTLCQETPSNEPTQNWLQIIHCHQREHWITATTIGCNDGMVKVYDSVYRHLDESTKKTLYQVFPNDTKMKVVGTTQKQTGGKDCGIFAIAFATSLAFGIDVNGTTFHQEKMRLHLARCFTENKMTVFPTVNL